MYVYMYEYVYMYVRMFVCMLYVTNYNLIFCSWLNKVYVLDYPFFSIIRTTLLHHYHDQSRIHFIIHVASTEGRTKSQLIEL